MSKLTSSLIMANLVGMGVLDAFPAPRPRRERFKNRKTYTEEESLQIEKLSLDKSSPGRKALKAYKASLGESKS